MAVVPLLNETYICLIPKTVYFIISSVGRLVILLRRGRGLPRPRRGPRWARSPRSRPLRPPAACPLGTSHAQDSPLGKLEKQVIKYDIHFMMLPNFYFVWETINDEDTVFLEVSSDVTIVDKVFTCEWRRHNRPPLQKFDKIPTRLYFTIYCYGKLTWNKSLFFINTCFRCCQSLKEIVNSIKRPSYPKLYLFIQFIKLAHLISR